MRQQATQASRGEASRPTHRCQHLFLPVSLTLDAMLEQYTKFSKIHCCQLTMASSCSSAPACVKRGSPHAMVASASTVLHPIVHHSVRPSQL